MAVARRDLGIVGWTHKQKLNIKVTRERRAVLSGRSASCVKSGGIAP
jgi:hypothetical protein